MKTILFAVAAAVCLPHAAAAGDLIFDCQVDGAAQREMTARLSQEEGQNTGLVTIGGAQLEALIYEAPETRTFLFLGDDYSLNYTVNITTGAYEFFADGSKAAEATGTCVAATDLHAGSASDMKS